MPQQQYAWLLALAMIAARRRSPDQDDPSKLVVEEVTGVAGCLKSTHGSAANDIVAALFISYLLFALMSAKKSAKTLRIGPDFCKFNEPADFSDITAIPHQIRRRRVPSPHPGQCQNDHLPTVQALTIPKIM